MTDRKHSSDRQRRASNGLAYFRSGAHVLVNGNEYRLLRVFEDGASVLEDLNTGRLVERHGNFLYCDYASGRLIFKSWDLVGTGKMPRLPSPAEVVTLGESGCRVSTNSDG